MADSEAQIARSPNIDTAIFGLKVYSAHPLNFFQLINPPNKLSSEIWHHIQISEFLKLQASDILLPHPSNLNSFCLGPRAYENPTDLISCEANRIPFMSQDINLISWADCLRAWPNPPESWITWYIRVAKTYMPLWQELNIADALSLSLSPLDKDENLLKTIGYF